MIRRWFVDDSSMIRRWFVDDSSMICRCKRITWGDFVHCNLRRCKQFQIRSKIATKFRISRLKTDIKILYHERCFSPATIATERRFFSTDCFYQYNRFFSSDGFSFGRFFLFIAHFFTRTLFLLAHFFIRSQIFTVCLIFTIINLKNNGFESFVLPSDGFDHLRWIEMALVRRIRANGSTVNLRKIAVGGSVFAKPLCVGCHQAGKTPEVACFPLWGKMPGYGYTTFL